MKRPLKITLIVAASLVAIVVIALVVVFQRLDAITERIIETEGSKQLDLATLLGDANVSLLGGNVTLSELTIDNPEGYDSEHLFAMNQISVDAGFGGLTSDPVRIDGIVIASPVLTIERGSVGGLADQLRVNLKELVDHVSEMESSEETTRLVIDQLTVTGATVRIIPKIDDKNEVYELTLPNITMQNIGTAEDTQNGAEIGRVVTEVAMTLGARAAESEELPPEIRAVLAGDIRGVLTKYGTEFGSKLADEIGGELGQAANDAIGAALDGDVEALKKGLGDEAKKGLGRLLGGSSEDENDEN
jgi:uncharacterized protein involved in outer membrane biogenesis